MEGITILATNTYHPSLALAIFICMVMTMFCALAVGLVVTAFHDLQLSSNVIRVSAIVLTIILIVLLIFLWKEMISTTRKTITEYTITIDDSVGYNEFTEKYEIISHKGDTYVVREKPTE